MQKDNELFIVRPSLKQHYGRTVTKEMEFDEYTEDKSVHQTLKDLVFTTEVHRETEFNGIKNIEDSKSVSEIPEGTILIWNELEGYIIPNVAVYKMKDLEDEIIEVKRIYKDNTDMNPKEG